MPQAVGTRWLRHAPRSRVFLRELLPPRVCRVYRRPRALPPPDAAMGVRPCPVRDRVEEVRVTEATPAIGAKTLRFTDMTVGAKFTSGLARQLAHPHGVRGRLVGAMLNRANQACTQRSTVRRPISPGSTRRVCSSPNDSTPLRRSPRSRRQRHSCSLKVPSHPGHTESHARSRSPCL
jgi:hypothetical protein